MIAKHYCPCCSNSMLRHLSSKHSYWYCSSCRIEMPLLETKQNIKKKTAHRFFSSSIESMISESKGVKQIATF